MQRQFAYDRLLERLYLVDDGWIVKGATALLARNIGVRGSLDIDLYTASTHEVAEADVRRAVELAIDWMRFEVGPPQPITRGIRLGIIARIGATRWVSFPIDIVGGDLRMTDPPDHMPALARGVMPDVEQRGYRVYPIVDHVADKAAATFEVHGESKRVSTRYRDLVDLVAILTGASIDAERQECALRSEFARRGLDFPTVFDVPDRETWERGYRAEYARSILPIARNLDEALSLVKAFFDPLFAGTAHGTWSRDALDWITTS
jgi:hypothetical protein